jgi:hypothetical protein
VADTFDQLYEGINPTSGSGTTEWFSVPTGEQWQANVKVTFNGDSDDDESEFTIYYLPSSGASTTNANLRKRNTLGYGDEADYDFELGPGRALAVGSDSSRITFNIDGLKITS